jgi:hypothetical protein
MVVVAGVYFLKIWSVSLYRVYGAVQFASSLFYEYVYLAFVSKATRSCVSSQPRALVMFATDPTIFATEAHTIVCDGCVHLIIVSAD